ncbi:guanitoxin biosynthesis heme-dependent pre-guanitoxin N-hydroxylase GntA [Kaistella palustris]|uniref:guanitoxin biosynthesis heme-dependent pre-guanitoxin N-hydroxylase GntA n=1 Tax=Kaistella palustris TaxID=493376 RepID=UPI0004035FB6|nr:guanitoxin biosynthesis heme-dependent pre-guanitoxin N-hydroxylase GntA [Kaistella palustris]
MNTATLWKPEIIENAYKDFILNQTHPCIMAKALFKTEKYTLKAYKDINREKSLQRLMTDLGEYVAQYDFETKGFQSFIAAFPNNHYEDELSFEEDLWQALQTLHEIDDCEWDPNVSRDPENPNFSFSLKGRAFYVVGLHPKSSRIARQAPFPTLVFNLHSQFEKLREMGTYEKVRDTIRANDKDLQGEINPVLRDFGTDSETKQYSGREVENSWKCPFHHKNS